MKKLSSLLLFFMASCLLWQDHDIHGMQQIQDYRTRLAECLPHAWMTNPTHYGMHHWPREASHELRAFIDNESAVAALVKKWWPSDQETQREFIDAYAYLNAVLKYGAIPELFDRITWDVCQCVNADITRAADSPGLSNYNCPEAEELFYTFLCKHPQKLVACDAYDPKTDTVYANKLQEWIMDQILIGRARAHVPGRAFPPAFFHEDTTCLTWAQEQGQETTFNATQWLRQHESHMKATLNLREKMAELLEKVKKLSDPLAKAALFTTGLVGFKPFADGNKRTARLITEVFFWETGITCPPLAASSRGEAHDAQEYYALVSAIPHSTEKYANPEPLYQFFKRVTGKKYSCLTSVIPESNLCSRIRIAVANQSSVQLENFPDLLYMHPTMHDTVGFKSKDIAVIQKLAEKTPEALSELLKKKYPNFWRRRQQLEVYSWIAALQQLSPLLKVPANKLLTPNMLKDINAYMVRTTSPNAYRDRNQLWNWLKDGNAEIGIKKFSPQELCLRAFLLVPQQKAKLIALACYDPSSDIIDTKHLLEHLSFLVSLGSTRPMPGTTHFYIAGEEVVLDTINRDEIAQWEAEQCREGQIKAKEWLRKRSHEFPHCLTLMKQLQKLFTEVINKPYGFSQAFRLFLGLLDLHPFKEGNKRTARFLASIILLQHGFPPMITDCVGEKLMNAYTIAPQGSLAKDQLAYQLREYFIAQIRKYSTPDHATSGDTKKK